MSDISETFPMNFQGAAQSEGAPAIICTSSDEEEMMDSDCGYSVDDLYLSSEEESTDVEIMARCIERQLTEPIAIPNPGTSSAQVRCGTPKPSFPNFPTFSQQFFNLGSGNGPVGQDSRIKANHPINICRDLRTMIDTPMLPPPEVRGPSCMQETPTCSYSTDTASIKTVASHFDGMALSECAGLAGCSYCVICGKSVQQIRAETVNDYIDKTVVPGETLAETERRKMAFLDGMAVGKYLLIPGGVSQAAACDGNWYSVAFGYDRVFPGTIPLN